MLGLLTMTSPEIQQNNPLHGLKLETLLNELVEHYGWEILADAINVNCFKQNPSMLASVKFLRKTQWAQEKLEAFYLYQFKALPKPDDEQYELPPRQRTIPLDQKPGEPEELWVGMFAERREHKAKRPENQRFNKNTPKSRDKSSYASSFTSSNSSSNKSSNKSKMPYGKDSDNQKVSKTKSTTSAKSDSKSDNKASDTGFVNPWTDEHY